MFYITAGLLCIELVIFCCFASGDEQPWNESSNDIIEDNDDGENQIELQKLSSPADDQSINQAFFEITCNKPVNKQTMKGIYIAND